MHVIKSAGTARTEPPPSQAEVRPIPQVFSSNVPITLSDGRKVYDWCLIHDSSKYSCYRNSLHFGVPKLISCWKGTYGCTYAIGKYFRGDPIGDHVCSRLRDLEDLGQQIVDDAHACMKLRMLTTALHDAAIGFAIWKVFYIDHDQEVCVMYGNPEIQTTYRVAVRGKGAFDDYRKALDDAGKHRA